MADRYTPLSEDFRDPGLVQEGNTYDIKWSDCCTIGEFTSKLTKIVKDEEEGSIREYRFENGVTIADWGSATVFRPAE